MDEEHKEKKHRTMMDEWNAIHQATLRTMRCDLLNDLLDGESKEDLKTDIGRLVKHKNKLANELGLN